MEYNVQCLGGQALIIYTCVHSVSVVRSVTASPLCWMKLRAIIRNLNAALCVTIFESCYMIITLELYEQAVLRMN